MSIDERRGEAVPTGNRVESLPDTSQLDINRNMFVYLVSVHGRARNHGQQSSGDLDIVEMRLCMRNQEFLRMRRSLLVSTVPYQFNELL